MKIFGYNLDKVFSVVKDAFAVVTALETLEDGEDKRKKDIKNGIDIK